jgi:hypothetical protein
MSPFDRQGTGIAAGDRETRGIMMTDAIDRVFIAVILRNWGRQRTAIFYNK